MGSEPWCTVGHNDVFPEEFPTFLTSHPALRRIMQDTHPELFDYHYWQQRQQDIKNGVHGDIFPYPAEIRFPEEDVSSQKLAANAC